MTGFTDKRMDLEVRLGNFALMVLRLVKSLPRTQENRIYGNQVLRSSSSMGANYSEAQCAASPRDFTNDLNRVRKEAKETVYWSRLITRANVSLKEHMGSLEKEAEELFLIFSRAVKTSKSGRVDKKEVS